MPFLTAGMLYGECGPWPCLTLKAHSGKIFLIYLGGCLRDLLSRKPGDTEIRLASMSTDCLLRWFHLIETSPKRFVNQEQGQQIANAGYSFQRLARALAQFGVRASVMRWKLLPKFHVVWLHSIWESFFFGGPNRFEIWQVYTHLLEDSLFRGENPRGYHCFEDEDNIGRWKKLCNGTQGCLVCISASFVIKFISRQETHIGSM